MTDPPTPHEEYVPGGRAIWQSEHAKTYRCPTCFHWVFTQYEGEDPAVAIVCDGVTGHLVRWIPPASRRAGSPSITNPPARE